MLIIHVKIAVVLNAYDTNFVTDTTKVTSKHGISQANTDNQRQL